MKTVFPKEFDGAEIRRVVSEAQHAARIQEEAHTDIRSAVGTHDTGIPCVIPSCEGSVMKEVCYKYFGDPRQLILGPGGRHQYTTVATFYCSTCGVSYHHMPPPQTQT